MKDPAFLFYSSDFLSGTMLMTDEEIGQYIKLICLQHQKGHLKEKDILNICKTHNEEIFSKFKIDEEGNYYNERLETEINKRKAYSESRRNNRKKKEEKTTYEEDMKNICNSYEEHMENENININKNIIKNKDRDKGVIGEEEEETKILDMWETQFNDFYSLYPKKVKKQDVKKWFQKNKPSNELFSSMLYSLEQFRASKEWQKDGGQFIPYPSTWLNQKRWEDEGIEQMRPMSALQRAFEEGR
jgi:hypothetical protein|nr:MAG TPA: Protein of unknown function (DUF1376) [Caudoviricetes sp.]DAP65881.1 MAG TPA: Protein of unknown function (DUF1376) [Caudoviricetes sp.]DAY69519.1 MAG TPA: Protein of unknown function (DUF1376) [Caudoviricetes sp.]